MYGDTTLTSSTSNQELIPLIKQLIAMLESGKPFVLSSRLLAGNQYNVNFNETGHKPQAPPGGIQG